MSGPQATQASLERPKLTFLQKCKTMRGQQIIVTITFLLLPLLLLFLFTYLPFFKMVQFSFYDRDYLRVRRFVGLKNYIDVFSRDDCFEALKLSLYYMGGSVVQIALALLFATILSFKVRGSKFFRGALYFPCLICGIAVGFIFKFFLNPGFVLDTILSWVGITETPNWLENQAINNIVLVACSLWKYMGQNIVLFIGAIASVDPVLYEAAELDGCNARQRFKCIIVPSIRTIVVLNLILSVSGALSAFVALVPIVSCVITAFKTVEEYQSTNVMVLPQSWLYFDNFVTAWKQADMGSAFLHSFMILICVLVGSVFISAMLAYVLNRFQFPGNSLIRTLFTIATLIPGIASQVTVYQIMDSLGLVNTMHGYIILMLGTNVITIYIFLQFFENLPVTLDESAIIDGCSYFGAFFRILFPLLKPAIVTSAILKGVSTYNEYYMAGLYLQDKTRFQVVSTALYVFTGPMGSQYNYICAGVLITIIPALIIFLLCQDQIYSGMAAGAAKG